MEWADVTTVCNVLSLPSGCCVSEKQIQSYGQQCYVNKASGHSRNQFTSWILNALLKLESRTAVTAQVCCTGRWIRKLKLCLIKGCGLTNGHSLASSNRSGTSLASLSRATSAIGPKITTGLRNPADMRQKKKTSVLV